MSTQQVDWFADLAAAAEDLGYHIGAIKPGRIVLEQGNSRREVVVKSVLLSGPELRRILRPIRRPQIENTESLEDFSEPRR